MARHPPSALLTSRAQKLFKLLRPAALRGAARVVRVKTLVVGLLLLHDSGSSTHAHRHPTRRRGVQQAAACTTSCRPPSSRRKENALPAAGLRMFSRALSRCSPAMQIHQKFTVEQRARRPANNMDFGISGSSAPTTTKRAAAAGAPRNAPQVRLPPACASRCVACPHSRCLSVGVARRDLPLALGAVRARAAGSWAGCKMTILGGGGPVAAWAPLRVCLGPDEERARAEARSPDEPRGPGARNRCRLGPVRRDERSGT